MTPRATRPLHREFFPQLQSIAWLNNHANTNDQIMTNSVYVPFYTQLPTTVVEDKGRDGTRELFVTSCAMKAKYLVLDTGMVGHYNREWSSMTEKKYRLIHVSKALDSAKHHTVNTYVDKQHSPIKEPDDTDPLSKVASTPVSVITTQ